MGYCTKREVIDNVVAVDIEDLTLGGEKWRSRSLREGMGLYERGCEGN